MYCAGITSRYGRNVQSIMALKVSKNCQRIHLNAAKLEKLVDLGLTQLNEFYFDTLKIKINVNAVKAEAENEINFRYINEDSVGIAIMKPQTKLPY